MGGAAGTPGFKTLAVSFFDAVALKASPGYASADEYFESVVSSVESRALSKREVLPGVGLKAAFVATPRRCSWPCSARTAWRAWSASTSRRRR